MSDHPQYAMWKARYEAERAAEQERAARRVDREARQAQWKTAFEEYKKYWLEGLSRGPRPRWWHFRAWLRILFGKSRPYR